MSCFSSSDPSIAAVVAISPKLARYIKALHGVVTSKKLKDLEVYQLRTFEASVVYIMERDALDVFEEWDGSQFEEITAAGYKALLAKEHVRTDADMLSVNESSFDWEAAPKHGEGVFQTNPIPLDAINA